MRTCCVERSEKIEVFVLTNVVLLNGQLASLFLGLSKQACGTSMAIATHELDVCS